MASHGGGGPHKFFKVLLPGSFEISLSLPPKFAAGLGVLCPWRAAAKLRDRTGSAWNVDIRRDSRDRMSFTGSGWRGFVSANAVSAGQLLVFEHRGGFVFVVERFDASGCCCEDEGKGGGGPDKAVDDQHMMMTAGTEAAADEESGNRRRRPEAAAPAVPPCTGGVKRRRRSPGTATTVASGGDDNETLCIRIERRYQLRILDLSKNFCESLGWTSSRDVVLCAAGAGAGGSRKGEKRWQVSVKVSPAGWCLRRTTDSPSTTPASSCHSQHLVQDQAQAPTSFKSTSSGATGDLSNSKAISDFSKRQLAVKSLLN